MITGYLRKSSDLKFCVVGQTDYKGNLKAFGVGRINPVTSNATEEGRAFNRRVELELED